MLNKINKLAKKLCWILYSLLNSQRDAFVQRVQKNERGRNLKWDPNPGQNGMTEKRKKVEKEPKIVQKSITFLCNITIYVNNSFGIFFGIFVNACYEFTFNAVSTSRQRDFRWVSSFTFSIISFHFSVYPSIGSFLLSTVFYRIYVYLSFWCSLHSRAEMKGKGFYFRL